MNSKQSKLNNTLSILISSINSIIFGLSLTTFSLVEDASRDRFSENKYVSYELLSTLSVSNIFLGGILFYLFNRMTNKKSLIILSTCMNILGYLFIYMLPDIYLIFLSRMIIGIGSGATCLVIPQYIYNLAAENTKGVWCSLHAININLGILIGQSLIIFNYEKIYLAIIILLSVVLLMDLFIEENEDLHTADKSIIELLKTKGSFKSIFITNILHASQHFSGVDYITIFLPSILNNEYSKIIGVYSLSVPSVILSSVLLEYFGRRILYLVSLVVILVSMLLILEYKVISLILFIIGYNIGLANIPWVVPNEVSPLEFTPAITKLGIISNWLSAYLFIIGSYKLHEIYGDYAFLVYGTLMGLMMIFTIFYLPETKGNKKFL